MTIATVVTRGYGAYSDVFFLPTHGYETGDIPPPGGGLLPPITLHIMIGMRICALLLTLGVSFGCT